MMCNDIWKSVILNQNQVKVHHAFKWTSPPPQLLRTSHNLVIIYYINPYEITFKWQISKFSFSQNCDLVWGFIALYKIDYLKFVRPFSYQTC
jgi:hypothetical protein